MHVNSGGIKELTEVDEVVSRVGTCTAVNERDVPNILSILDRIDEATTNIGSRMITVSGIKVSIHVPIEKWPAVLADLSDADLLGEVSLVAVE